MNHPPPPPNSSTENFADALACMDGQIAELQEAMARHLSSDVELIRSVGAHVLGGGKRLRAVIALLAAKMCGVKKETRLQVAAAIEFIHTATLLHDDVVDEAPLRRRQPTANLVFGNAAAVLSGDFLYSRASQMLAATGSVKMLARVADATNRLAEGEVLQLVARNSQSPDEAAYFEIIERKTANLFEVAAAAGAILGNHEEWESSFAEFGRRLGLGFQLIDDCLDYGGNGGRIGKAPGRDFSEGKMTLPLIVALSRGDESQRQKLSAAGGGESLNESEKPNEKKQFDEAAEIVRQTGALEFVRAKAAEEIELACAALSVIKGGGGEEKTLLLNLARLSARRDS